MTLSASSLSQLEYPGISGPALAALSSLTASDILWIKSLPKAELHAHLNGCVPIEVLYEIAGSSLNHFSSGPPTGTEALNNSVPTHTEILSGLETLSNFALDDIHEFFGAFRTIYALISTRKTLGAATRAVLQGFLDAPNKRKGNNISGLEGGLTPDDYPECTYLELRTTPRRTPTLSPKEYLETVLDEVEKYPRDRAALIVSLDRRMGVRKELAAGEERITIEDTIDLAILLKNSGRRVVGVDLCGDPSAGDMSLLEPFIAKAKSAGLRVTLHIAETPGNSAADTLQLLSYAPNRLGHATFLDEQARELVLKDRMLIEVCLSSNIICKTVPNLSSHHISHYLDRGHPIAVCTDDTLPFRTSLTAEYALLLAPPPLGLGLTREEVQKVAEGSINGSWMTS
ncbi:hypothetical protein C8J55DRAFT_510336 [Lentinula edodes]|uniref:Adenosine deaminase domain-containing protein n=1 Tax=Lentinula lateritia TaxID=40482 RepID=A0A9W9DT89_9AGAR|nr:hypothetical protein C8J55DRAFT_510336 [Lentinula edodes]